MPLDRLSSALRSSRLIQVPILTYRHLSVREQDVMLASYPKSGNTWLKFMLAQLLGGHEVDFDSVEQQIPPLGDHRNAPPLLPNGGRIIKSHEPYRRPYGGRCRKVAYVVRDGRDVAVSYYFHQIRIGRYRGGFSDFLTLFLDGKVERYGAWSEHVSSWLASPVHTSGGMLLIRYENVLAEPARQLSRLADFLGVSADDETVARVAESNRAEEMRAKERGSRQLAQGEADIPFVRSATAGDWRNHFSASDEARFEERAGALLRELGYLPESTSGPDGA